MFVWNPLHGCHKISEGCKNCYVYRTDAKYGNDSSLVKINSNFSLPVQLNRNNEYKLQTDEIIYTCFTSDFFLEDADEWRAEAWEMIRIRTDLRFLIVTKRIDRFNVSLPEDWGSGYDNVEICCTVENQDRADYRLPIFMSLPIKKRSIICEPLLEPINLRPYLNSFIKQVVAGGESGYYARLCDYNWILDIRQQCIDAGVSFYFKQTGARFKKDNKIYIIDRKFQHSQAKKANINYDP